MMFTNQPESLPVRESEVFHYFNAHSMDNFYAFFAKISGSIIVSITMIFFT